MSGILNYFKKNVKIFAISLVAILFAVAGILSCCFLIPTRTESVSAEISGCWTDSGNYSSTKLSGSGSSKDDPYLLTSAADFGRLVYLHNKDDDANASRVRNGKFFKVTKPINLSEHNWEPLGTSTYPFSGTIDFGNNPVVGMTVSGAYDAAGFIGYAGTTTISNAIFSGFDVKITGTGPVSELTGAVGGVIGRVNNNTAIIKIENSMFNGSVTHEGKYPSIQDGVGGIIGSVIEVSSLTFTNISTNINISAPNREVDSCIGKFVGYSSKAATINYCIARGSIPVYSSNAMTQKDTQLYAGFSSTDTTTSDWFFMNGLNGDVPQLKSQYWIGKLQTQTNADIYNQLTAKGFLQSSDANGLFVRSDTLRSVSVVQSITNGNPYNATFTASAPPRSGYNKAVWGEKVALTSKAALGYSFKAYTSNVSGVSIANSANSSFVMPNRNITVTAVFQPNTYTLTANATKGEIFSTSGWTISKDLSTATKTVTYDAAYGTLPEPKKAGYVFDGWCTSSSEGSKIEASTIYNLAAGDSTIYAHWTVGSYTLKLNANGGTLATSTESYTQKYGTSITIADPERTGYTFAGWIATKMINGNEWMQVLYHNNDAGSQLFSS